MAGAATAITHPAMQRMYRDMARFRDRRMERIQMHRAYSRSLFEAPVGRVLESSGKPLTTACFQLCAGCGYMEKNADSRCPHCAGRVWIDLGNEDAANILRDHERNERQKIPVRMDVAAASIMFLVAGLSLISSVQAAIVALAVECVLGIPLYFILRRKIAKALRRFAQTAYVRWRLPVCSPKEKSVPKEVVDGEPSAFSVLRSPLTGRKCLGYKVSVLFDVHGDARPPEWVLAESQCTDFSVDDTFVGGERTFVDSPLEPVQLIDDEEALFHMETYLAARGLFLNEGDYWLYESVLPVDSRLEVEIYDGPGVGGSAVARPSLAARS